MQASSNPVCGTLCSWVLKLCTLLILTFYWFGFQPYRCKRQPLSVCPVSNIVRLFHAICCFCLTKESQILYEKLAIGLSKFAQGSYASWKPWKPMNFWVLGLENSWNSSSLIHFGPWKYLNFNWGTFSNLHETLVNTSFEATKIKSALRKPIIVGLDS